MPELAKKKCVPCEGEAMDARGVGTHAPPMSDIEAEKLLTELNNWKLYSGKLSKEYSFADFNEAIKFVNKVAVIAEAEGHHPDVTISYNKVKIELITHAIGGLSENDFILAAKIDEL
ncbi:MAG: 4a-hydroxytetrahydrobiopterin dehydratase [Candidatus Aenigmarchaeota archaeon]|nr:4a-hydroxytetrahydrobiopterin dehydratase [Candidatus Aenigmarchaeota archaeon]